MSNNLKLKLLLNTFDNISGPLKNVVQGSRKTSKQLRIQQGAMKALQRQQNDISSFQRLRKATRDVKKDFDTANETTELLKNEINRTGVPTKALIRNFKKAEKVSSKLEQQYKKNAGSLRKLKGGLKSTGINTRNLTSEQKRLTGEINTANNAINKQKKRLSSLAKIQSGAKNIVSAGGNVVNKAGNLAKKGLIAAGLGGLFFKTQLLDTAAEFENYEAVLKVVEGSGEKARKALDWSSTFAAKTPFELDSITEAYVKLRTYGLNPTNGLLQTLGDTSAAMNKPLLQSVEAIADAITGENERLKEFGITASKTGDNITYDFVDKNDKQQSITINGNDRKAIEDTLKTIWNAKFKGAMVERSKTWEGMLSNMGDHWKKFSMMIMSEGLFDWMKAKLGGLLDKVNQMAADGTLQKLAKDWGNKLTTFATGVWNVGSAIVNATSYMSDLVGGGENLVMLLAGISLVPLISSFITLGIAMGPVGLAIAGISAAGLLIYKNWDGVSQWLTNNFDKILTGLGPLGIAIKYLIEGAKYIYKNWDGISAFFSKTFDNILIGLAPLGDAIKYLMNGAKYIYKNWNKISSFFSGSNNTEEAHNQPKTPITKPPITRSANNDGNSKTVIENINVHPAPGMDETQLANKVAAAIAENERKVRARHRSQMRDTE